ncbi:MAG: cation:proton antiporter [Clostridia bacterium]|nr:cation:proton antiporter [Clostridia bacterium]
MSYEFLIDLALILLVSKIFSILSKDAKLPKVLGAMVAGLVLGPSMLGWIHETDFIAQLAKLGVIVIMFSAGLDVNLKQIKEVFKSSFLIALLGVLCPVALGVGAMVLYNGTYNLEALFIGIIFTATSVAISVETLRELGKLNSKVGNAILAAAVIDDVLGVIALSFGMAAAGEGFNIWMTLLKIALFFVLAIITGVIIAKAFEWYVERFNRDMRRFTTFAFVYCLVMAYVSEVYFGLSAIIGAFVAGLVISNNHEEEYIAKKIEVLSYLIFSPMFFASIGLQVQISEFGMNTLILALIFIGVAVLSKIIGCAIGAICCKYSMKESIQIGIGMVGRGEVVLILANKALEMGVITTQSFTAIIIAVIFCAIITPILLKLSFKKEIKEENSK